MEDGERRVDDLVGRDELRRHNPRVELPRVTHDELERGRAVQEGLQVVARAAAEQLDVDHVRDGAADELLGGLRDILGHGAVDDDLLAEEFLRDDLDELYADAVVEQVVLDEPLELRGVGVDDDLGVLGVHAGLSPNIFGTWPSVPAGC